MKNQSKSNYEASSKFEALIVSGIITSIESEEPVSGIIVEAINTRDKSRLGTATSNSKGLFQFSIKGFISTRLWRRYKPIDISLQLLVLAPERSGLSRNERILFSSEVRENSSPVEEFLIRLPEARLKEAGLTQKTKTISTEEIISKLKKNREKEKKIAAARSDIMQESIKTSENRKEFFRTKIRPAMEKELSQVTDEEAASKEFVTRKGNIKDIQYKSFVTDLEPLSKSGSDRFTQKTKIALTEAEKKSLIGDSTNGVTLSEKEMEETLGIPMDKPAKLEKKNLSPDECQPYNSVKECINVLLGDELIPDLDPDNEGDLRGGNENGRGAIGGEGVSFDKGVAIATLTERMVAPEDPVEFGADAGSLETPQTVDHISASIANLTFAPGPADVPSFHNFHDLQIAFAPVWQEALDDRFIQEGEDLYNKYVEKGGDAAFIHYQLLANISVDVINAFLATTAVVGDSMAIDFGDVVGVVQITESEWDALPAKSQQYLLEISNAIKDHRQKLLEATVVDDMPINLEDLDTIAEMRAFAKWQARAARLSKGAIEIREKLRLLKNDAAEMVAMAKRLLLELEAEKPFNPTHSIIEKLKIRHSQTYPFRAFAANKRSRSVNFGTLVTYQQIWTPKSYQVGEMVKTIPLAPNEIQKYSLKTKRKTKSSIKEIESRFERETGESSEKGRIEKEILRRATAKTNFDYQTETKFNYGSGETAGVNVNGKVTTGLKREAQKHSQATKKEFNEQVRKATQEVKSEQKTEINTEESFEEEYTVSGEIKNPNDEISCTFLFYELQRRYQIEEKIHQLQAVVLVAQEVPEPHEIDKAWLIRHDWILSRVLLDPSYAPALGYLSTSVIADEVTLKEMRKALFDQRKLVEDIKQNLLDRRISAGLRYGALQKQVERSARKAEGGGGLLGSIGDTLGSIDPTGLIESGLDLLSGGDELDPATEIREKAARDAFDRERREEQELEGRLQGAISTLGRMQEEYTTTLSGYLTQLGQCHRLIDHVWSNILYYMQAIWSHEHRDQQYLRLRKVQVPIFEKDKSLKKYKISAVGLPDTVANPNIINTPLGANVMANPNLTFTNMVVDPGLKTPPTIDKLKTRDLADVADLNNPVGMWANYLIFPLYESNVITEFMSEPYVTLAEKDYGLSDPDTLGNMTLDEFSNYVCCLKKYFDKQKEAEEDGDDVELTDPFEALKPELRGILKKLLERAGPEGRDIVVPMDGLYIEALPGAHSVMERFKQMHRQIDVKKVQAEVREMELDNVRQAERIIKEKLEDPDIEKKIIIKGGSDPVINT